MGLVTKTRRSDWGLDSHGVAWEERARCAQPDVHPDWWHGHGHDQIARAKHICWAHCEVRAQCDRDAQTFLPSHRRSVVLGGVAYGPWGLVDEAHTRVARDCVLCRPYEHPIERERRIGREQRARRKALREARRGQH